MNKMTPQIRFQGFTDDWEQRKLSNIGDIVTGNTPKTSNSLYYNGSFLFVSPADIQETRYIYKTNTTLTAAGFNTGRLVKTGSTLFVSIGSTIGKVAQASTDVITNQQINSIVPFKHYDNNFIYTSLVNIAKKIKTLAVTQAVPIINKTEFSKNIIYVPDLQEQQKIGLFFKQLDDTIALHQRMLDLLKEQKKGFLQKMFPKNSAKVPELRFSGFADNWEERKLGEVGKTKSGIGFSDAQQGGDQGIPFYKVSDMNNPGNEVVMMNANNYASDAQIKENKWKPINPQNSGVVFAKVGAAIFLDRKRIVDTSFLIDNNMMSYLFDSSWNRYFGKTLFEKLRLSRFAQVGALPSFNGSDVEDIKVMITEESEQQQIGSFFKQLDHTIALHQRMLDLLKEQKKGFLQKMFVS
ncbi:restriction endonuclease subunit S [Leuconostoc suionicum]|uniref:restriction endonuclease subunit S n=1 Tax=Leuconostoc suionicum TaxID=1511761 RepID=UPI0024AD827A|nr:restriction endonuclease subunit S [Leuconostoc suionicum]MDI6523633.1 restriction endonuclease subunit S [Leuconostoc suionicum]